MTLAAQDNGARTELVGNGTAGPYSSDFKIDDASEVEVLVGPTPVLTTKVLDVDYEVTIGASTFDITFLLEPFPQASDNVVLLRKQSTVQLLDLQAPNQQLERALDDSKKLHQQVFEVLKRCLKFAKGSLFDSIDTDDPSDGKFLYYDQAAGKFKWATLVSAGTLPDPVTIGKGGTGATTASGARTNLGLGNDSTGRSNLGAAPQAVQYAVLAANSELTVERILTAGTGISFVDGGAGGTLTISSTGTRGYLFGLTLSNNGTDVTNDIDITAGECASDDVLAANRILLNPAAMTKQLDAVWAAGSAAGGRISSESLVNGTWHVFAFRRSGGADDFCFSQSLTPTLPDGGTKKRRIGSILRAGGTILGFIQDGDYFRLKTVVDDIHAVDPGTSAVLRTLSVPTGLNLQIFGVVSIVVPISGPSATSVHLSDPAVPDEAQSGLAGVLPVASASNLATAPFMIRCNTSGQIRSRMAASAANYELDIHTHGWIDTRGRLG